MANPVEMPAPAKPARQARWTPRTWAIFLAIMLPVLGGGGWMVLAAERQTSVDPSIAALARANAGGDVQAFTGAKHTVYQSLAPLPGVASPRTDGKPTLVWFTTSNCSDCGRMDAFAHQTAALFSPRMVFVEKAADRDVSAARFAVTTTPTFVLIDAAGRELTRFGYQPSPESFAAAIAAALRAIGR